MILLSSHNSPLYGRAQVHVNRLTRSSHTPPFSHGLLAHSSISTNTLQNDVHAVVNDELYAIQNVWRYTFILVRVISGAHSNCGINVWLFVCTNKRYFTFRLKDMMFNRLARSLVILGQPLASQLGRSRSGVPTSCYNSVMGFHLAIKLNTKIRNPTQNM